MARRRSVPANDVEEDVDPRFIETDDDDFEDNLEDDEDENDEEDDDESGTEDDTETESVIDWDSDANPFKARLQGFMGSMQGHVEQNQQLTQALVLKELEVFQARLDAQQLDPQVKEMLMNLFKADMGTKYRLSQAQDIEARAAEAARKIFAIETAQKYGLTKTQRASLERFDSPEEMEEHAKALSQAATSTKKKVEQVKRQSTTKNKFGSGGSGRPAKTQKSKNLDDAANRFANRKVPRSA